jgi:hypothetical protein
MAASMLAACGVCAAEPARDLSPGKTLEIEVAGTPPSLADIKRATNAKSVRMAVKLPDNYEAGRSFPVLVFLNGGDGGNGCELHQAEPFLGGTNFILCNMPIFKQDLEGDTADRQLSITPLDGPYAAPAFHTLFQELHRLIPNIDESRSVLAGFSNGANTTALILWTGDQELLARFSAFVLIEGGFWLGSDRIAEWPDVRFKQANLSGLARKRILLMYGDQTAPADRIPFIQAARKTAAALRQAGVEVAEMPMTNVGHDFPPAGMARAREWVLSGK